MSIYDLHTSKARYELKVVLLYLRINDKANYRISWDTLNDFFIDKTVP